MGVREVRQSKDGIVVAKSNTLDYGDRGRATINEFLARGHAIGTIPEPVKLEFVK